MNIDFSDKYEPLFNLLEAWDVVKDPNFKDIYSTDEQKYWVDLSNVDTVLMSGGRDSGKSFALSNFNGIAAKDYNHRILYTRQTMASTDNSITEALEGRLEDLGYDKYFQVSNKTYTLKNGDTGKISITGQKTSVGTQTAKLKSLEDYSIFETDEGEELSNYEDWKKTKRSMRAKDVQNLSIIVFNPPTREHWIAEEFYEGVPDGFNGIIGKVLYIHTTYIDNGRENMADHNWIEYEALRLAYEEVEAVPKKERELLPKPLIKKWKEYKHDILGGFRDTAEGVIYDDWEIGEFDDSLPYCYGEDFGFKDPDVIVKVAIDERTKKIYIHEVMNKNGLGTDSLAKIMIKLVGTTDLIVADQAHARLINDLYHKGLNIHRCKKGGGSVARTIKTVQGYTLIFTPTSTNAIRAVRNYVWHDKRSEVPRNDYKHFPDAWGYAAIELIYF